MDPAFFAAVRKKPFGGKLSQKQVDGLVAIGEAWTKYGDGDSRKLAYVLSTAYHETAHTMQPVTEYGGQKYLRSKKYWPYIGRGYVQLTWESNYHDWSNRLGVDLVAKPDLALRPDYAARILIEGMMLGTFTKKKLVDYITKDICDFKEARRIVNGTDKAALIAGYAASFLAALPAKPVAVPQPKPVPAPVPAEDIKPPAPLEPKRRSYAPLIIVGIVLMAMVAVGIFFVLAR